MTDKFNLEMESIELDLWIRGVEIGPDGQEVYVADAYSMGFTAEDKIRE